jgi:hypothetical protein
MKGYAPFGRKFIKRAASMPPQRNPQFSGKQKFVVNLKHNENFVAKVRSKNGKV